MARSRSLHGLSSSAAVAALALASFPGGAGAFTLTDHAVKAFIRPCKLVEAYEAEASAGVEKAGIVEDKLAANGQSVRLKIGAPALRFTRQLERGTYAVWCIGRTEKEPSAYREPMYVDLLVKGPAVGPGGVHPQWQWRTRINYMARMHQDVAHMYFDANAPGEYEIEFRLGEDSAFDLLVDRLELRDVLAGTWKKGYKTESTVFTAPRYTKNDPGGRQPYPREEALERARGIAAACPPRNTLIAGGGMPTKGYYHEFRLGDNESGLDEPNAARWLWRLNDSLFEPWAFSGLTLPEQDELDAPPAPAMPGDLAIPTPDVKGARGGFGVPPKHLPDFNWGTEKPGPVGRYTAEDFARFRKLPGRWPDNGGGFYTPRENSGKLLHNFYFNNLAGSFKSRWVTMRDRIAKLADEYYETGDPRTGFTAAVMLAHFADAFPSMDYTVYSTMLTTWGTYPFNCFSGSQAGEFGKLDYSGWEGPNSLPLVEAYDKLFPIIKDNALLAEAIAQSIPWVRKPEDVVELIDVKLVQHFYDVCERGEIRFGSMRCEPIIALVQGDNEAGREMLRRIVLTSDFQFASLLDTLVCKRSRDTTSFIGSMFYAKGPSLGSGAAVAEVTQFARRSGVELLDLVRNGRTRVLQQAALWLIEPYTAGMYINGVGDVSGPQGQTAMALGDDSNRVQTVLYEAWKNYGDPRFAWMLQNAHGYPDYLEKAEIEKVRAAAAEVPQDPRHVLGSRALEGFGVGVLENHVGAPDFRKRTGVAMRAGYGSGHSHADGLNIEVFAKGMVAVPEFGGRPGYGTPPTGAAQSHCLVTVDGRTDIATLSLMADLPGMSCMQAGWGEEGKGPAARRFVALVDGPGDEAYLFDVARASGGRNRTYWFHGQQTEAVETPDAAGFYATQGPTLKPAKEAEIEDLEDDIKPQRPPFRFSTQAFSHNVLAEDKDAVHGDVYEAVWPLDRTMERQMLGRHGSFPMPRDKRITTPFDPDSPRKFTRLFLAGSKGRQVKTVVATSEQVQYRIVCAGIAEEKAPEAGSVFPAVIEPFAGEPFVSAVERLPVRGAEAGQPVAVSVGVGKQRRDIFYQSNDSAAPARIETQGGLDASGQVWVVSFDDAGPRACALVGGTEVRAKGIGLKLKAAEYAAVMTSVDHRKHEARLDRALPASLFAGATFLMGHGQEPFRVERAEQRDGATVLHFAKTAETYRAPVFLVRDGRVVIGPVEPEHRQGTGWLENESGDKGWPVVDTDVGNTRWMGTGFRGGARMGGPISWDSVPDADGDGKRALVIKAHGDWKEDMRLEVLTVDPELRSFSFVPMNSPAGYGGTRSYANGQIVNEAGQYISTSVIPGKMGSFSVPEGANVRQEDFTDADGDGQVKFHVYHFGPGGPVRLPAQAALQREAPGHWRLTANAPVEVTLPAAASVSLSGDGKMWRELKSVVRDGMATFALEEADLAGGRVVLRAQ